MPADQYIKDFKVVYGDTKGSAPDNRLREMNGKSDDINCGFDGDYVWLVPEYTSDPKEAACAFNILRNDSSWPGHSDLAKGAGGDFRYVCPLLSRYQTQWDESKITEVIFVRSDSTVTRRMVADWGWHGMSDDINDSRAGDFLHILWKTTQVRIHDVFKPPGWNSE